MKKFLIAYTIVFGLGAGAVISALILFPDIPFGLVDVLAKEAGYVKQPTPDYTAIAYKSPTPNTTATKVTLYHATQRPEATAEVWRIPMMRKDLGYGYDRNAPEKWVEFVKRTARNLAIPEPYLWETFTLGRGAKFSDVEKYYMDFVEGKGYQIGFDYYDESNLTGLITFVSGEQKIAVEFWTEEGEMDPFVLVIYKNF